MITNCKGTDGVIGKKIISQFPKRRNWFMMMNIIK